MSFYYLFLTVPNNSTPAVHNSYQYIVLYAVRYAPSNGSALSRQAYNIMYDRVRQIPALNKPSSVKSSPPW